MKNILLSALLFGGLMMAVPAEAAQRALLIGVGDYQRLPYDSQRLGRPLTDLQGPPNDVRLLKEVLISRYGFAPESIQLLTDREATRQAILDTIEHWLIRGTKPGDQVVLFFSGHGIQIPDRDGDEDDPKDEALVASDLIPEGAGTPEAAGLIVDDELGGLLRRLKDRMVTVLLDACYSGTITRSIGGVSVATLEPTPASRIKQVEVRIDAPPATAKAVPGARQPDLPEGVIVITAAQENELAVEQKFEDGVNGTFTRALVEELKTSRDLTYQELFEATKARMKDRYHAFHAPRLDPAKGPIVMAKVFPPPASVTAQATLPRPDPLNRPTPVQSPPSPPRPPVPVPVASSRLSPEVVQKVLVRLEPIRGASPSSLAALRSRIAQLPAVEMVEGNLFDRLIRGEIKDGRYHLRLLNGIGDVTTIEPTSNVEMLAPHLEYAYIVKELAHIQHPNPAFRVKLSVTDATRRDFAIGEKITFNIRTDRDAYILLLTVDGHGNVQVIFPNRYHPENFVRAKTEVTIPDERMIRERFEFEFAKPIGEETVKLIATTRPFDLTRLGLTNLREDFPALHGPTRSIVVKGVKEQINQNIQAATSGGEWFEWSEATVVVRSHERK